MSIMTLKAMIEKNQQDAATIFQASQQILVNSRSDSKISTVGCTVSDYASVPAGCRLRQLIKQKYGIIKLMYGVLIVIVVKVSGSTPTTLKLTKIDTVRPYEKPPGLIVMIAYVGMTLSTDHVIVLIMAPLSTITNDMTNVTSIMAIFPTINLQAWPETVPLLFKNALLLLILHSILMLGHHKLNSVSWMPSQLLPVRLR